MSRNSAILVLTLGLWAAPPASEARFAAASDTGGIPWQDWSDAAFERARREGRFVLLDLGAVWCHWCHVMEETTYRDPDVTRLIRAHYVPVKVDQDSRPDLSNRYEDYGWPATVIFDGNGRELVKFQGYIPPARMASLLQGVVDDPTPGPSVRPSAAPTVAADASLTPALRQELLELMVSRYDRENGSWGFTHKFLDWDSVEHCLVRAREGDPEAARMARQTLDAQLRLIDPVWGGVYQYSHGGTWDNPHFEKIMAMQAENMRVYAQAYALWGEPRYLRAARDIHRYLRTFLTSPEGAFYTSQDADVVRGEHSGDYFALSDPERRKRGIPRVDTHRYTRENAWAVNALVALHAATGDRQYLEEALRAARWILESRALPEGGFRHDERDAGGPYMGDSVVAGRAFLSLYTATADRSWLARAEAAAAFIGARFLRDGEAGFLTAQPSGTLDVVGPQRDENIVMARFANLLYRSTAKPAHRALAEHAMRYLASPEVATRFNTGGILLSDRELGSEPLHLTVVGGKDDHAARALHQAALADPSHYKRVELWDRRDGPLPNADVQYPELKTAAAFVCGQGRCSAPAYAPEDLRTRVNRLFSSPR